MCLFKMYKIYFVLDEDFPAPPPPEDLAKLSFEAQFKVIYSVFSKNDFDRNSREEKRIIFNILLYYFSVLNFYI